MTPVIERSTSVANLPYRAALQRAGNPFRNYFARNPDDDVCSRFHVAELYQSERELLLAVVDLYRNDPTTHSEIIPILGNKGAGKTHLLHSIKHGNGGPWQLLVTPGVYQKDTDFLEYLLFQVVDTLLGGGRQKGVRPLEFVGEVLARRLLSSAVRELSADGKMELFPLPGIGRWARKLGIGGTQANERADWLAETIMGGTVPLPKAIADAGLTADRAFQVVVDYVNRTEAHNTAGLMRKAVLCGFAKAVLLKDEADLANFLTYGFAELDFKVRPTRQDLVLALFKVLMDVLRSARTPVVVAFDQLEDLLLARRTDDAHKIAEAFFAGIVQGMHQIDGLCFLVFAERGLWNRFVPSLDGYIQDRLNNPVHVPGRGTVKAVRLEAPPAELVGRVVDARLRPTLAEIAPGESLPSLFPFTFDQVRQIAATEPTLRDMLQQFRHLFDHLVYGSESGAGAFASIPFEEDAAISVAIDEQSGEQVVAEPEIAFTATDAKARIDALLGHSEEEIETPTIKSIAVIETSSEGTVVDRTPDVTIEPYLPPSRSSAITFDTLSDLWDAEIRSARRRLEPDGALTGATRELQSALGTFLATCHEHGVKVGPWRLQHVVPEFTFGEHPTYGVVALAHWACKDGQPWKVGIGLFLARGAGKPKDLEIKLGSMEIQPNVVDHLILMRPDDDLSMTGKSKQAWAEAERRGRHARLEPATLDGFAVLSSFPRWLAAVREALPAGTPLPNLADVIQAKCEKLLEQVCMPVTA
ncbi:MAG: hypothetical protein U0798_04280 [Gemmataceae bacterium]